MAGADEWLKRGLDGAELTCYFRRTWIRSLPVALRHIYPGLARSANLRLLVETHVCAVSSPLIRFSRSALTGRCLRTSPDRLRHRQLVDYSQSLGGASHLGPRLVL